MPLLAFKRPEAALQVAVLLGEGPMQGISLFAAFESSETLICIQRLITRIADGLVSALPACSGWVLCSAFIGLIMTDQNSALGFPKMGTLTTPGENYFISSVEFS